MQDSGRSRRPSRNYARVQAESVAPRPPEPPVVYLTAPGLAGAGEAVPEAQLVQMGLQFFPSVLPVQVGTRVYFPNEDDTYHNVFSYSPAGTFDKGRYKKGETPPSELFETPGEIQVFCEVHDHMRATILVLDTPYFTTADESGNFALEGIPPGTYTIHVWWNTRTTHQEELVVTDTPVTGLNLKP